MKPLKFNVNIYFYGHDAEESCNASIPFVSLFDKCDIIFNFTLQQQQQQQRNEVVSFVVCCCIVYICILHGLTLRSDRDLTISISSISCYTSSVHPWQGKNGGRAHFVFLATGFLCV